MPSQKRAAKRALVSQRRTTSPAKPGTANHLFDLVHDLDAIVWEADAQTWQFTFVSEPAERMLGYPVRGWLEDPDFWVKHIHPDDREKAVAYCREATKRSEDHRFEYRFLAADGRIVWLRDLVHVVKDRSGRPERLHGVMVDITEGKREEEQLGRHLQSLQAVNSVAASLNQSFEAASVIREAIQEITKIFHFEATRIFFEDPRSGDLCLFSSYETRPELWTKLRTIPKNTGIAGRVLKSGQAMILEDIEVDALFRELRIANIAQNAGFHFFAVFPIKNKAKIVGVMVCIGQAPRRLQSFEQLLIDSITEQIGVAYENAELFNRLQRNLDRTRALHEVNLAVNSNLELNSVLNVLFDQTGRLVPHAAAEIRLLNRETGLLEATACRNLDVKEWKAVRAGRGLAKIVLETQAPLAIRDVQRDPRTSNPEFMRREGIVSFLGVPLTVIGDVIGCFIVFTREDHDFVDEEIELFSALASQAALAIHKARLYEQVTRQTEGLTAANAELKRHTLEQGVVAHLGDLALGGCDLQSLMDEAVVLVTQVLQVEYAKVLELLPGGHALALRAGVGWKEGLVGQATVGAGYESQAGYTLLSYEPVVVEDLSTETRFNGPPLLHEHGVVSGVSVVIHGKNGAYGVLGAHSTKRRAFTREQVAFVQTVANLLATAIERKRAEEALRQSESRYRTLFEQSRDAIWITTRDGKFIDANGTALALLGYDRDELLRLDVARLYADPKNREKFRRKIDRHGGIREHEARLRRKDGVELDCLITASLWRDANGVVQGYQSIIRNVTQRKRFEAELQSSRTQLRAFAANLQAAREEERTTVAREIHDELGQTLTGLKMDLAWLRKKLPKDQEVLLEKADAMLGLMNDTINAVRRISTELRPGVLDELGLSAAIEWQAREFEKRTGIRCGLDSSVNEGGLDKTRSTALFRIFQEALTNIARHANATRVRVRLDQSNGQLRLQVRDNGGGIRKSKLADPQSLGLLGMRERAMLVGGDVVIADTRGKGTAVTVKIPMAAGEQGGKEKGKREERNGEKANTES